MSWKAANGLAKLRQHLDAVGVTESEWRQKWNCARDRIEAKGSGDEPFGNLTITVTPGGELSLRLPRPLEHLANAKHGRYVLSGAAVFSYRAEEWLARITGGKSIVYTITRRPGRAGRYLTASWATPCKAISVDDQPDTNVRVRGPIAGVDLNDGHLPTGRERGERAGQPLPRQWPPRANYVSNGSMQAPGPRNDLSVDSVERGARLQVDERRGISLRERQADVGALPGVSAGECRHPNRQPVCDGRAVPQPDLVGRGRLVGVHLARAAVFLEQIALAAPAVLDRQRSLQEVPEVQRPVAAAGHLPVQESDLVAGKDVGVADVRVAVQKRRSRAGQRADVACPDVDEQLGAAQRRDLG